MVKDLETITRNLWSVKSNVYLSARNNCYDKLVKYGIDDDDIYCKIGQELKKQGNHKDARKCYTKAFELNPLNTTAQNELLGFVPGKTNGPPKHPNQLNLFLQKGKGIEKEKEKRAFFLLGIALGLLILAIVLLLLAWSNRQIKTETIEIHRNQKVLDYEIFGSNYQSINLLVPTNFGKDELVKTLHATAEDLYQVTDRGTIYAFTGQAPNPEIVAAAETRGRELVGKITWGTDERAKVYLYEHNLSKEDKLGLNLVRNALVQYYKQNKTLPIKLQALTEEYPGNYLSAIPDLEYVYTPTDPKITIPEDIAAILMINKGLAPYEEIKITIDKERHLLFYQVGNLTYKTYQVGLGKNNTTPEGVYTITKRVAFPQPGKLFGTRGLELSVPGYAIHGTSNQTSIGNDYSMGCIRMLDHDIEELYSLVPLGIPVVITAKTNLDSANSPYTISPADIDKERSPEIFKWKN